MGKRIKKPIIRPDQRFDWLSRYENGESPPKIAKKDKVDVRTVRKHIEWAKQEMEVKEARSMVLRNALERHYEDLCDYARTLGGQSSERTPGIQALPPEYMGIALRQHLPRSPIWSYINQRNSLQQRITQLTEEMDSKIEEGIKSDSRLNAKLTEGEPGLIHWIITVLKFQVEQWVSGGPGLSLKDNLATKRAEEGSVNLHYGAFQLGKAKQNRAKEAYKIIREVLQDWESRIKQFEEYEKLEKSLLELRRIEKNLDDEIAVITLRRVVPGRCRYCPL